MTQTEITPEDRKFLDEAAKFFRDPGLVAKGLAWAGKPVESLQNRLPEKAKSTIAVVTEKAIKKALIAAVKTIPKSAEAENRERASIKSSRLHRAMTTVTGAAGGLIGLPALAIELPVTTILILRAISDQARLFGHDLSDLETRLECLMVFTMGVPEATGEINQEKPTASYFATRASFVSVMRRAAATAGAFSAKELLSTVEKGSTPILTKLVGAVAEKFQVRVSQKFLAEGIPIVGAIGGGALNYAFTDFFVTTARYHCGIRALEKKYGDQIVQDYFGVACAAPEIS
jgi:hypothetical protein